MDSKELRENKHGHGDNPTSAFQHWREGDEEWGGYAPLLLLFLVFSLSLPHTISAQSPYISPWSTFGVDGSHGRHTDGRCGRRQRDLHMFGSSNATQKTTTNTSKI